MEPEMMAKIWKIMQSIDKEETLPLVVDRMQLVAYIIKQKYSPPLPHGVNGDNEELLKY